MRMHTRVGLVVGGIGFVLLFLARGVAGLAALAFLALVAVLAGLAMAKWLPRDWYGRQLEAGARAGAIASGLAILGLLCALGLSGPRSIPALARQSHLVGLDLGPAVRALGSGGWVLPALVLSIVAAPLGTALAGMVALVAGWDKNRHAVEVVNRAREAAQQSGRLSTAERIATGSIAAPPPGRTSSAGRRSVRFPRPSDRTLEPAPPHAEPAQSSAVQDALAAWAPTQDVQSGPGAARFPDPARPTHRPRKRTEDDDWLC